MGPWLTTLVSSAGVSSAAVEDRSRHTIVGSSSVVCATLSSTRVSVSSGPTSPGVHTTSVGVTGWVPGPRASVNDDPRAAVTVTVAPAIGAAPGLVTMIREG